MSRSGYEADVDNGGLYRGAVHQALNGRRGQKFLMELKSALEAMPEKELTEGVLISRTGECCTLGVVLKSRGVGCVGIDPDDAGSIAEILEIAPAMVQEIEFLNDDDFSYYGEYDKALQSYGEKEPHRWERMYQWVCGKIRPESYLGNKGGSP